MKDWLFICMQVVDSLSDVEGKFLPVFPIHLDVLIVKKLPKRTSRAKFKNNAEVGLLGASTQEQNNVRMADYFHDSAFVLEFFKFVLLNNFALDLFNCYCCMLPTSSVHDSVTAFR